MNFFLVIRSYRQMQGCEFLDILEQYGMLPSALVIARESVEGRKSCKV